MANDLETIKIGNTEFSIDALREMEMNKEAFKSIYGKVLNVNIDEAWKQISKYCKKTPEKKGK